MMMLHHQNGTCRTTIKDLSVTIGKTNILSGVSFSLFCGELTVIIGPNGAGKTTLLKALLHEIAHEGTIAFHSAEGSERKLRVGYVPQKIHIEPNSPISVYDFFAAFASWQPVFYRKDKTLTADIKKQLALFDVDRHLNSRLGDLSGGELQRVMLALAVYPTPELLILDEPVSGMDRNGLALFYQKLTELKKEQDITILLVSHDLPFVREYADRILLLNKTILAAGRPQDVMSSMEFYSTFSQLAQSEGL